MKTPPSKRPRRARPTLENLETRDVPTVSTGAMLASAAGVIHAQAQPAPPSFINMLTPTPQFTVSTVPTNGDVNPYGVAFVPLGFPKGGPLKPGDVLVSNFNSSANLQGTGTTIVATRPGQSQSLFYQSPNPVGLSTALSVLKAGYVIVGNVPTTDGTFGTIGQGSLIILDRYGREVANLTNPNMLNGPWDMAVVDHGDTAAVFVSNVLNGTITRIDMTLPKHGGKIDITRSTTIASGYSFRGDPVALVLGVTGLAFNPKNGTLYVAETASNAIFAVPNALHTKLDNGTGRVIYQDPAHLHGPLALGLVPNGNLLVSNADVVNSDPNQPSELVEFTTTGQFVSEVSVDPNGQGGAFGFAFESLRKSVVFAAVDDLTNQLKIWEVPRSRV